MSLSPALYSSARDSWNTPPEVLDRLRAWAPIGLDPCSNASSIVHAATEWRLERGEDGLSLPWADRGLVFVNPPYGRALGPWLAKCTSEGVRGVEVVALVTGRPDTRWFQAAARSCAALHFWAGRLTFLGAPHPAPFPSCLFYWGPRPFGFLAAFEGCGLGVRP